MGAPVGNKNAANAHIWKAAILRALDNRTRIKRKEALDELAEALLAACAQGDIVALKELGNRLDGAPTQNATLNVSGAVTHEHIGYEETSRLVAESLTGETKRALSKPLLN